MVLVKFEGYASTGFTVFKDLREHDLFFKDLKEQFLEDGDLTFYESDNTYFYEDWEDFKTEFTVISINRNEASAIISLFGKKFGFFPYKQKA